VISADHFPRLRARDLTGYSRWVPDAFEGRRNLVFVAFRRDQQAAIDSWAPWLASAAVSAQLGFYELPVLARRWAPMRPLIDGGMAAAVRADQARRRTMTVYGDVGGITGALGITDRTTVTIFLVDRRGQILDRATGPFEQATATRLAERSSQ
jgi:hypothetical protein